MSTCPPPPPSVTFFYADAEDTEQIFSGISQLEMLLMSAPTHRNLLLSTKMPMGILHCLWATTWSVFKGLLCQQLLVNVELILK
jgi:hypothetical protein